MKKTKSKNEIKKEISAIVDSIDDLSRRLTLLEVVLDDGEEDENDCDENDEIRIGDYVVITNTYKNFQGVRGKVINVTKYMVDIKDIQRKVHRKNKCNIAKLPQSQ